MSRSPNAATAAALFNEILATSGYGREDAWKAIARLFLTCKVWESKRVGWLPFKDVVVYREANDFIELTSGEPNSTLRKAEELTTYLAEQLDVRRVDLCRSIGLYFEHPTLVKTQPHNIVGHGFRTVTVEYLRKFGDPSLTFEEEVDPRPLFPGNEFNFRSNSPKVDVVAFREDRPVAMLSCKWRYRHDRTEMIEEGLAYAQAIQRSRCRFYAVVGEFDKNRLGKVLSHCPPAHSNPAIHGLVHFNPNLILKGLGMNGSLSNLKSFDWIATVSYTWR